jgi:dUTPase
VPDITNQTKLVEIKTHDDGLYISGTVNDIPLSFLVDTGASVTIISTNIYQQITCDLRPKLEQTDIRMTTADGTPLSCTGTALFQLEIQGMTFTHKLWVADISLDGILGLDFLNRSKCSLDLEKSLMLLKELQDTPYDETDDTQCCKVSICHTKTIPPESESLIPCKIQHNLEEGTTGIIEPTAEFVNTHDLLVGKTLVDTDTDHIFVRILNPTLQDVQIHAGTHIATFEAVTEILPSHQSKQCNNIQTQLEFSSENTDPEIPEYLSHL